MLKGSKIYKWLGGLTDMSTPQQLIVEPKASDWNGDTGWGASWNGQLGQLGLPGGDGSELALPQFTPSGPPRLYEVHLTQRSLNDPNILSQSNIYARITYGVGAANHEVVCDWKQGSRILIPGGNIQVTARQVGPNTCQLLLGVSISKSAGGHLAAPTFTPSGYDTGSGVAGLTNFALMIPQRASRLIVRPGRSADTVTGSLSVQHVRVYCNNSEWHTATTPELCQNGVLLPGPGTSLFFEWSNEVFSGTIQFTLD